MKGSQGLSSCGGWWAQPFGQKSCASLAIKPLMGQASGQSLSLFRLMQAVHASAATQYGSPKGIAVPPPANGASGPRCMPLWLFDVACRGGGAKDTLREDAKFTPSFVIIAMGDSSQGPSQDLSPSMASGARDMPQGGSLGSLDG